MGGPIDPSQYPQMQQTIWQKPKDWAQQIVEWVGNHIGWRVVLLLIVLGAILFFKKKMIGYLRKLLDILD